jgi:N-acetylneuraminic acid mutarotase
MNKIHRLMLFFFAICGMFLVMLNPVLASDLVEDSWHTKASMNQARAGLGAVVADSKIYAIGGYTTLDKTHRDFVGTNERYNPVTNTWTVLEPMPTPRSSFAIVTYQNKIYCIAGYTQEGEKRVCLGVNEVYDVITDNWSTKAPLTFEGVVMGQVLDEKIFVMPHGRNDLYMYDPITDAWTTKTSMPLQGFNNELVVVNNTLMVIFDYSPSGISESPLIKVVMIYDSETDTWSERKGADTFFGSNPVMAGTTTGRYAPQKIYLIGGTTITIYDPERDSWSTAKAMPTNRANFAVTVLDDTLYVVGGERTYPPILFFLSSYFKVFSVTEQYIPLDHSDAVSAIQGPFLDGTGTIIVFLTASIVGVISLFLYFRLRKNKQMHHR